MSTVQFKRVSMGLGSLGDTAISITVEDYAASPDDITKRKHIEIKEDGAYY